MTTVGRAKTIRVFLRDGWACRMPLCLHPDGRVIDCRLIGTKSRWAPTIDHVIPRAQGGTDRAGNLRAAHRECNEHEGRLLHERLQRLAEPADAAAEPVRRGPWGGIITDPYD